MSEVRGEKAHSVVGASSASRFIACPGSVALSGHVGPGPSSVYADEGTAAHELGENCLLFGEDAEDRIGEIIEGKERSFEVDAEMAEAVQVYVDFVKGKLKACRKALAPHPGSNQPRSQPHHDPILRLEYHVDLSWLRSGMFGTADTILIGGTELLVADYKHGQGVAVEVKDNPQLRYYALGPAKDFPAITHVTMAIVQPRAIHPDGPIRSDRMSRAALMKWAEEELGPAVDRTREPNAPRAAGDHCRWCSALAVCPEALAKAQEDAALDFTEVELDFDKPADLVTTDIETLSKILAAKDFITKYLDAVAALARRRLDSGEGFPGWKLVRGKSRRKWSNEEGAFKYLKKQGIARTELVTEKSVSPAQAEKILAKHTKDRKMKKVVKEELAEYWEKPPGSPRMVPEDQAGESLDTSKSPDVPEGEFGLVETETNETEEESIF